MSDVLAGKIIAPVFDVRVGLESLFVWNRKDRRQGYWAQIFKDAPHFINCHPPEMQSRRIVAAYHGGFAYSRSFQELRLLAVTIPSTGVARGSTPAFDMA